MTGIDLAMAISLIVLLLCGLVFLALALQPAAAPYAAAQTPAVARAVDALRDQSVHSDPDAEEALSEGELADIEEAVDGSAAQPLYIAVLPDSAGNPDTVLRDVAEGLGRQATYLVVVEPQPEGGPDRWHAAGNG